MAGLVFVLKSRATEILQSGCTPNVVFSALNLNYFMEEKTNFSIFGNKIRPWFLFTVLLHSRKERSIFGFICLFLLCG